MAQRGRPPHEVILETQMAKTILELRALGDRITIELRAVETAVRKIEAELIRVRVP